jgi:hypothetical protein
MAIGWRTLLAVTLVLCTANMASADGVPTMADFVSSARYAAVVARFAEVDSVANTRLQRELDLIESSGVTALSVHDFASAKGRPSLLTVGHGNRESFAYGLSAPVDTVGLQWSSRVVRGLAVNELMTALTAALTASMGDSARADTAARELLSPATDLQTEIRLESIEQNLSKLRRYEKKFGPRSPRLNGLETLVNYAAQFLPGFGPDNQGWPGPLELIAAYDTAYLTIGGDEAVLVSTVCFGMRYYFFGDGWGKEDGLTGMLRPAYVSGGVLFAAEDDGALRWPWEEGRDPRPGGFLTWGDLKFAYVGGDESRFMLSREFQAIPWVF